MSPVFWVSWFLAGVVWLVGFETLRGRRAKKHPGRSTTNCLEEAAHLAGCLVWVVTGLWALAFTAFSYR